MLGRNRPCGGRSFDAAGQPGEGAARGSGPAAKARPHAGRIRHPREEAARLRWDDVNFADPTVTFRDRKNGSGFTPTLV
jgi:hypothetical protein